MKRVVIDNESSIAMECKNEQVVPLVYSILSLRIIKKCENAFGRSVQKPKISKYSPLLQ